jgi:hypothetical protein
MNSFSQSVNYLTPLERILELSSAEVGRIGRPINLGEEVQMSRKTALGSAALVGAALLTSSLSFAQQPPTPSAERARVELASPAAGILGVNTKTYSAIVRADGVLILGPAGSSSFRFFTGTYQMTFPSDVSNCVYTATIGTSPAAAPGPAIVTVTPRSGIVDAIFVRTFSLSGATQDNAFNIQVQC